MKLPQEVTDRIIEEQMKNTPPAILMHVEEVVQQQRLYEAAMRMGYGTLLESDDPNSAMPALTEEQINKVLEAAGDMSTTGNLPTLPSEWSEAIIRIAWPKLLSTHMADIGVMKSPTGTVPIITYARVETTSMGTYAQGGAWVGAGVTNEYPRTLSVEVTTKVENADIVVTATCLNAAGTTDATTVATIPQDSVAGTIVEMTPALAGDTFISIASVAIAGAWNAGAIKITVPKSAKTSELAAVQKAGVTVSSTTITAITMKLKAHLSSEVIEDAKLAIAQGGAGGIDIVQEALGQVAQDIVDELDWRYIYDLNTNAGAGNVDWSQTKAANYTEMEWQATFADALTESAQYLDQYGWEADAIVMNSFDFAKRLISGCKLEFVYAQNYGSPVFQQTGVLGTIRGFSVYKRKQQARGKVLLAVARKGSSFRTYIPLMTKGPVYDADLDKDLYLLRQRSGYKVTNGYTLSTVTVVA